MQQFSFIAAFSVCVMMHVAVSSAQLNSDKIVVLKNGHIIEGKIIKQSNEYSVLTNQGSRIVLAESDVEFTCKTLTEAYWQKNARLRATDLAGHQELFYWCLKYNVLEHAQNQIDIISTLPIKASDLEYIHRQLVIATDQQIKKTNLDVLAAKTGPKSQLAQQPSPSTAAPSVDVPEPNIRPLPDMNVAHANSDSDEPKVAQVGFTTPVEPDAEKSGSENDMHPNDSSTVSIDELEKLTKSLPKPAVAMFKRKIEPLIVRSCYADGCHRSDDNVMPLMRVSRGQLIPRRMSQRNLHSILKYADPNEPLTSPLLTAAMTAHGGLDEPIIEPATPQFENLATWLIMTSNKPYSIHQMPARDEATLPSAAISDLDIEPPPPTLLEQPNPAAALQPAPPQRDILDKLKDIARPEVKDPRDPSVFNKMFRKK